MSLIDTASACFTDLQLESKKVEGFPVLSLTIEAPNGKLDMYVHAHDDKQRLLIYLRPQGIIVTEDKLSLLADYITRANYGLPLGNFELDMNDGELNFKNSLDVNGGALTKEMVKTLVLFAIECVNRYLPGVRAVLNGGVPKDAIEQIDGPSRIMIT